MGPDSNTFMYIVKVVNSKKGYHQNFITDKILMISFFAVYDFDDIHKSILYYIVLYYMIQNDPHDFEKSCQSGIQRSEL